MSQKIVSLDTLLSSEVLVIAPHMDDEILGCGGLMLLHEDKSKLNCVYASDGGKSPEAPLFWQRDPRTDLAKIRESEAREAVDEIGLPPRDCVFLNLPDGGLSRNRVELEHRLEQIINRLEPDFLFVPFRFDLHSDHVAVHRAVRKLQHTDRIKGVVLEYFVYARWRLISGGDIRRRIREERLMEVDTTHVTESKRKALSKYRSQSVTLYEWQEKPVLTEERLRLRCHEPEWFLIADSRESLLGCFTGTRLEILLAHYLERYGKRRKDQLMAFIKWVTRSTLWRKG